MKKFLLGLTCGLVVAGSSAAFASDSIQALLFPASFEVNGSPVEVGTDAHVLNVEGHAYVPVRFVAEQLGANIDYDADAQKIIIKNKPLDLIDLAYKQISVGNLILTKEDDHTKVTGQLRYDGVGNSLNMIGAGLTFYNADNVKIGEAPITGNEFGVEPRTFVTEGTGDFRDYTAVYLHIGAINYRIVPQIPVSLYTSSKFHFTLNLPTAWEGKYTVEEMMDETSQRGDVLFIDKANRAFGGVLFAISIWTKEDWQLNGVTAMGIGQLFKVGEDAGHVYTLSRPGDVEYNLHDAQLSAEYEEMAGQVSNIRTSFMLME